MRERVIGMSVMWIAVAISIGVLVDSIRYTEVVDGAVQVTLMPGTWQFAVAALIFVLIMGAIGGTIAIWETTKYQPEKNVEEVRRESTKMKRDRQARVRRLLETMDDDDLNALESGQLGDDGERLSLQELMRRG